MALINLQTNTPKLNVSNIKSPFGSGAPIPKISAGAHPQIRRPSVSIKPAKLFGENQLSQIRTNVSVADNLSRHDSDINSIAGQLAEINAVMQDIGGALALDFANRITEQKQDNKNLKDQVRSTRRSLAESSVEGVKKIGKGVGSGITGVASKSAGGLSRILEAGKFLGLGTAINALWPNLTKIFDWSKENLDKILLVGGGLLGIGVVAAMGSLVAGLGFLLNPATLTILGLIAGGAGMKWLADRIGGTDREMSQEPLDRVNQFDYSQSFKDKDNFQQKAKKEAQKNLQETSGDSTFRAPMFHDGGIVGGPTQEVPAILERGEAVLTKEQLALISKKPGINLIEMDLPPITIPSNKTAKNISLPDTTDVQYVTSVNSANKYMTKTPEIHGIIG